MTGPVRIMYGTAEVGRRTCETCREEVVSKQAMAGGLPFGPVAETACRCVREASAREEQEALERAQRAKQQEKILQIRRVLPQTDDDLEDFTFDRYRIADVNRAAYDACLGVKDALLENPTGKRVTGVGLIGPEGAGKSHLLAAIVNVCVQNGVAAIFTTPNKMARAFKATYRRGSEVTEEDLFELYASVPLLALDDLGKEQVRNSRGEALEHFIATLYDVMNERCLRKLPVVVSANRDPEYLKRVRYADSEHGRYIIDRIFESINSRWIEVGQIGGMSARVNYDNVVFLPQKQEGRG